ncbi:aminotransferase class IV [Leifsonia sp. H3M29-4]|uniref:aminotransferase class IV n=1 Tax=Salinibacterium metalliresistens TaxID=3031321 RepID=UPI0023DA137B|nr:aminotransferase class IV [Salinibacterium metalliresistens]MDF1478846.1 aminotransferase class IV [Salinibacterium metalliresistens]
MSVSSIFRWQDGALEALDYCDMTATLIEAADSWLVTDGLTLALDLHRARFFDAVGARFPDLNASDFWDAAIAAIPDTGTWFPRVELHSRAGAPSFVFRLRSAPERRRSAVVATWHGPDPRRTPRVKGPDLERLSRARTAVQSEGADEAVLLTTDGYVVEGAYSALLWWRGEILCAPPASFARVDSVTARSVLTLARALGHDLHEEAVTPAELDGTELWTLSALHGIRIVTAWIDGPQLAELPGRLGAWRARLDALRRPIHRPAQ